MLSNFSFTYLVFKSSENRESWRRNVTQFLWRFSFLNVVDLSYKNLNFPAKEE